MFKLTKNQWSELGRLTFERRMIDIIRHRYPVESRDLNDEVLGAAITVQAKQAKKYRLFDEQQGATYVLTAWILGEDFDTRIPILQQVLSAHDLTASEKSKALTDFTLAAFNALSPESRSADAVTGGAG